MDEEVITWNLKGPKRFKKRKELNALIKNNVKYKGLARSGGGGGAGSNSLDMYTMNIGGSAGGGSSNRRLLKNANSTSSEEENEQYYFSANKEIIREYIFNIRFSSFFLFSLYFILSIYFFC